MTFQLSGYLYFHAAPNAEDFHQECVKRVKNLHTADCLRANKSTMAWGLEARVPFLDKAFLEVAMNVDAKFKMFSKGAQQKTDEEGRPMMEKVSKSQRIRQTLKAKQLSISFEKPLIVRLRGKRICQTRFSGGRRSRCVWTYIHALHIRLTHGKFSDGVGYSWIDGYRISLILARVSLNKV